MTLSRYLQIGEDSVGVVTKMWTGWSPWQETVDDFAQWEHSARFHRDWGPPDNLARRYHPGWVRQRYLFERLEVQAMGETVKVYDDFNPEMMN